MLLSIWNISGGLQPSEEKETYLLQDLGENIFKRVQFALKNTQNTSFLNLSLTVVHLPQLINKVVHLAS